MVNGVYRYIDKSLDRAIKKEYSKMKNNKRIKKKNCNYITASKRVLARLKK